MFAEAGCGDQHISEQRVKGSKPPNLICTLPGSSDQVIIVGAHFDRTPEGDGVVDNWSGASLLPSLYAALRSVPRQHTYIFIGFTDEEDGEVGSHFYVHQMTKEQAAATDAMVNIDTLGLAPTKVWVRRSDHRLAKLLAYIATRMNLPMAAVNVDQVGSSDGEQFAKVKIPRITIHSLTQETWNADILHTSKDRFSAIRLDDYYQSFVSSRLMSRCWTNFRGRWRYRLCIRSKSSLTPPRKGSRRRAIPDRSTAPCKKSPLPWRSQTSLPDNTCGCSRSRSSPLPETRPSALPGES